MRRIAFLTALVLPVAGCSPRLAAPAASPPPSLAEIRAIPKIDVHSHYESDDTALVGALESWNVRSVLVNVLTDGRLTEKGENMWRLVAAHPERFVHVTTFDPAPIDDPDFAARTIARLRSEIARGAKAVKVWKTVGLEIRDRQGRYVQIDDPRYQPIWDFLAEQRIPVLAHIGEPQAAWLPLDPNDPHYGYYSTHPEYHAYVHPEIPRWETIIAARDRWVERNPRLVVVGAHLASLERDVDEVAKRLDRYPNLYVETAARINDLVMQPTPKVRDFMIRYQDRVLYGTDFGEGNASRARLETGFAQHWSYLAGADSVSFGRAGAWNARVPGLALPRAVLEKIGHLNAERVLKIGPATPAVTQGVVRPGIELFLEQLPPVVRGKRVGLITNQSGIDRERRLDIDLIAAHPDLELVALFAPEHGIRGTAAAGERVSDEVDARTGIPIYSLYMTEDRGPTPEMLREVDVLVYDLQEVGGRTWTYVSTMALSMQAARAKGIPFVVLDRPNPIGGEIVEGALLDPRFRSFVGMYPIPARHGMTVGELATLFNREHGIGAELIVVKAANWRRSQWMDDAGLPWVNPSPNLRSLAALTSYPGSVYFEGTNLSEGRGTERPFEQVGAPWLDAPGVAAAMNALRLPGIRFEPITMAVETTAAKFPGQTIPGIRFAVTDREGYRPVRTMLLLIDEIRRRHPAEFRWSGTIDRLTGSDRVRTAIEAGRLAPLLDEWDREAAAFAESRRPYLLYP